MTDLKTILVVDRDRSLVNGLVKMLRGAGLEARGSTDPVEAAELVERNRPRVVIVDPLVDGAEELVRLTASGGTRIIVFTWPRDPLFDWPGEHADPLTRMPVDRVVLKTASLSDLVSAIRQVTGWDFEAVVDDKPVVLVVDDDELTRERIATHLRRKGYRVLRASAGQRCLQLLDVHSEVAVVLLDVFLPDTGGLELLAHILDRRPVPAVVMVSALADRVVAQRALEAGAFDYIQKPVDIEKLESSIIAAASHTEFMNLPWWKRLAA